MEQSHSEEANFSSTNEEIPRILWNPLVHYRFHISPQLIPTLSQINLVHTLPTDFFTILFNIIFQFTPVSPK